MLPFLFPKELPWPLLCFWLRLSFCLSFMPFQYYYARKKKKNQSRMNELEVSQQQCALLHELMRPKGAMQLQSWTLWRLMGSNVSGSLRFSFIISSQSLENRRHGASFEKPGTGAWRLLACKDQTAFTKTPCWPLLKSYVDIFLLLMWRIT